MTRDTPPDVEAHAWQPRPSTPEADVALASHLSNLRTSLVLAAERLSGHETILRDDIHAAIAEVMSPKSKSATVSDWFKWIGFFFLGLTVPVLISVYGAENTDKLAVIALTVGLILSFSLLAAALVLDLGPRRRRIKSSPSATGGH